MPAPRVPIRLARLLAYRSRSGFEEREPVVGKVTGVGRRQERQDATAMEQSISMPPEVHSILSLLLTIEHYNTLRKPCQQPFGPTRQEILRDY